MRHVKTSGRRRESRAPARLVATRKLLGLVPYGTGKVSDLARELKLSVQAVSRWKSVPVHRVAQVEKITGVPRHVLRPDVYDPPTPNTDSAPVSTAL